MDILTEQQKQDLERFYPNGLGWLRHTLSHLSSSYALKAGEIALKDGAKDKKYLKLQGIAKNLTFGTRLIEKQMEYRTEWGREKANLQSKFYDLHKKIDAQNEEIKRLKKQNTELKKNIEL